MVVIIFNFFYRPPKFGLAKNFEKNCLWNTLMLGIKDFRKKIFYTFIKLYEWEKKRSLVCFDICTTFGVIGKKPVKGRKTPKIAIFWTSGGSRVYEIKNLFWSLDRHKLNFRLCAHQKMYIMWHPMPPMWTPLIRYYVSGPWGTPH